MIGNGRGFTMAHAAAVSTSAMTGSSLLLSAVRQCNDYRGRDESGPRSNQSVWRPLARLPGTFGCPGLSVARDSVARDFQLPGTLGCRRGFAGSTNPIAAVEDDLVVAYVVNRGQFDAAGAMDAKIVPDRLTRSDQRTAGHRKLSADQISDLAQASFDRFQKTRVLIHKSSVKETAIDDDPPR